MSITFVMLNWWPFEMLDLGRGDVRDQYNNPDVAEWIYRGVLLVTIILKFAFLTGAIIIMVIPYLTATDAPEGPYPGVMVFVQNVLIFIASGIMRAGTITNCNGGSHEQGWV